MFETQDATRAARIYGSTNDNGPTIDEARDALAAAIGGLGIRASVKVSGARPPFLDVTVEGDRGTLQRVRSLMSNCGDGKCFAGYMVVSLLGGVPAQADAPSQSNSGPQAAPDDAFAKVGSGKTPAKGSPAERFTTVAQRCDWFVRAEMVRPLGGRRVGGRVAQREPRLEITVRHGHTAEAEQLLERLGLDGTVDEQRRIPQGRLHGRR